MNLIYFLDFDVIVRIEIVKGPSLRGCCTEQYQFSDWNERCFAGVKRASDNEVFGAVLGVGGGGGGGSGARGCCLQ